MERTNTFIGDLWVTFSLSVTVSLVYIFLLHTEKKSTDFIVNYFQRKLLVISQEYIRESGSVPRKK